MACVLYITGSLETACAIWKRKQTERWMKREHKTNYCPSLPERRRGREGGEKKRSGKGGRQEEEKRDGRNTKQKEKI